MRLLQFIGIVCLSITTLQLNAQCIYLKNGGFEQADEMPNCESPNSSHLIERASHWSQVGVNTADYFRTDADLSGCIFAASVRSGNGSARVIASNSSTKPNYREFVRQKTGTMYATTTYKITYYYTGSFSTEFGLLMTDNLPTLSSINNQTPLNGTTETINGWRKREVYYTPSSDGQKHLVIGPMENVALGQFKSFSIDDISIEAIEDVSVANAGPDQVICNNSTSMTGNMPLIGTGTWTSNTGATFDDPNDPYTSVSNLAPGENILTWKIADNPCEFTTDQIKIYYSRVDFNLGPDITVCDDWEDYSIVVTPNYVYGDVTYNWTNGHTSSTIDLPGNIDAIYGLTVTDEYGCSNYDEIMITAGSYSCEPYLLYENGDVLPLYSQTSGNIDIYTGATIAPGEFVTARAEGTVNLGEGFEVTYGNQFHAYNGPCNMACTYPLIELSQTTQTQKCQAITLSSTVSSGTAPYQYLWSNGQTSPNITINGRHYAQTFSLTVTDANGFVTTEQITVPVIKFYGPMTVKTPITNIFTPNGDGINDNWLVIDNNHPNGDYNAFAYDLEIKSGWRVVYQKSETVGLEGFNSGDIRWNGIMNNGNTPTGFTFYYVLDVENCNNTASYASYFSRVTGRRGNFETADEEVIEDPLSEIIIPGDWGVFIHPNPTSTNFTIQSNREAFKIEIYNYNGQLVQQQEIINGEEQVNIEHLESGVYFIKSNAEDKQIIQKLIKH